MMTEYSAEKNRTPRYQLMSSLESHSFTDEVDFKFSMLTWMHDLASIMAVYGQRTIMCGLSYHDQDTYEVQQVELPKRYNERHPNIWYNVSSFFRSLSADLMRR